MRRTVGSLLVLVFLAAAAPAKTVRVFAVGSKLEIRYADTYQNFHDKMFAVFDRQHPRRGELVQVDADDVASHLQPVDANAPALALANFPEDVGLVAGLIGSRGASARRLASRPGEVQAAFFSLDQKYTPQIQYYKKLFPGQQELRYLLLAETDTFYRAAYETFRELAQTYHVYLTATFNVAAARRIDAVDAPDVVALLRDPDEASSRDYAYVALAPQVFNTTFIFDPDGNILIAAPDGTVLRSPQDTSGVLRGSLNKAYLTEEEEVTLPLSFGRVQDLDVVETPVGRIASVISKDAWMIDVNDRYDAKGANLILQPEAFSAWGYVAAPWEPDGFKAGGFAQVQRNPSFLYNVAPCMTGNLSEVTFDGQSAIIAKRRKVDAPRTDRSAWIGQNPDTGFRAIAPWIVDDPILLEAGLGLADRRTQLADAGAHLLPAAKPPCSTVTDFGACENGYRESVIHADLELPDGLEPVVLPDLGPRSPTAFGPNILVAGADGASHRHAHVAARAATVYVVWQDDRHGYDNIFLAVSTDRGAHFVTRRVSDNAPGTVAELRPVLALSPNGQDLFVAWQELCVGRDDSCGRIKVARFDSRGQKVGRDLRVDQGADGVGKWNPALAVTRSGVPLVVWVDERDAGPEGFRFEHIYFARGSHRATRFSRNVRVDSGAPVLPAVSLDNKWAPTIAAGGTRFYVSWTDFRNYNWDIYLAHSRNGAGFSTNVRVDDAPAFERIDDHPSLAVDDHGSVHAVWADRRDTAGDTNIFYASSVNGGRAFSANRQIDSSMVGFDPDVDTPSNQWSPRLLANGSDLFVVWQDNRLGNNDVFFARSRDRGVSFEADERVDDTGEGRSNQYRPDVATDGNDPDGRTLYVVWEDDRNGTLDVFLARRALD